MRYIVAESIFDTFCSIMGFEIRLVAAQLYLQLQQVDD